VLNVPVPLLLNSWYVADGESGRCSASIAGHRPASIRAGLQIDDGLRIPIAQSDRCAHAGQSDPFRRTRAHANPGGASAADGLVGSARRDTQDVPRSRFSITSSVFDPLASNPLELLGFDERLTERRSRLARLEVFRITKTQNRCRSTMARASVLSRRPRTEVRLPWLERR
jgi:hypothetical protein